MAEISQPDSVLMVGSIPFENSTEVFTRTRTALPDRLYSIPDGETGERLNWLVFQLHRLPPEIIRPLFGGSPSLGERKTYSLESILPTLYDEFALSSYAKFTELRNQGIIAAHVRFQVCLPTPLAVIISLCKPEFYAEIEPLYEQRLAESIKRIVDNIPHQDLVIQWDIAVENYLLEQERGAASSQFHLEPYFSPVKEGLQERMTRVCQVIPADVPIAFHFCYGDYQHKHWMEPTDTGLLVDHANLYVGTMNQTHRVEWVHLPVPINRKDAEYLEPLKNLRLSDTRLYLGLVHAHDEQGTRERIEVARSTCPYPFGVATECGLGRTSSDDVDSILGIFKAVTTSRKDLRNGV